MLTSRHNSLRAVGLDATDLTVTRVVDASELVRQRYRSLTSHPNRTAWASTAGRLAASAGWWRRYVAALIALDHTALLLGGVVGQLVRFQNLDESLHGVAYADLVLATVPVWVFVLATGRTYESRFLGLGSDEFRRVVNSAAHFAALLAFIVFATKFTVARGLVVVALPVATVLTLAFRYAARKVLHRLRCDGVAGHRVLVVGEGQTLDVLAARLAAAPYSGLAVVGTCPPPCDEAGNTVIDLRERVATLGADVVAVAHSPQMGPQGLRRLAWSLEGAGVDLLLAPALTDVAGPRVHVRPVSGLPLLQVSEPDFSGVKRIAKSLIDRVTATIAVLIALPVMLLIAVAVRAGSPGPVLFRQERIGRDGRSFVMFKFRSMYADAEERLEELRARNDHGDDGVLFKMVDDPRITPVGRWLRRYSLDELPQLLNVISGRMSLVGPRPPLLSEVTRYPEDAYRRLLVKPGLTGLWQVSGRSDLDWDETVRLDLYYVENWSVALDVEIIWKTAFAVLRGSGAR